MQVSEYVESQQVFKWNKYFLKYCSIVVKQILAIKTFFFFFSCVTGLLSHTKSQEQLLSGDIFTTIFSQ